MLDVTGKQHKLWKEWRQGNRSMKYLEAKEKDRRVPYQAKCTTEKDLETLGRDDQKCDVLKIAKRMGQELIEILFVSITQEMMMVYPPSVM